MDMSSLSNGLPRPADDPVNIAFKDAALSITTLYKASQKSRREGYLDALDDMWKLFFLDATTEADVDITKLATWLNERRRNQEIKVEVPIEADFETEAVNEIFSTPAREPSYSPARSTRPRNNSPAVSRQRTDHDRPEARTSADPASEQREQRERDRESRRERTNGMKRRVVGAVNGMSDFHKRGRFG